MVEKIADLHIHSCYSDGTMSPEEILEVALAKNVGLIAITDHDILEGSIELIKLCKKQKIQCISGVELDSLDNGNDIHILGLGVNLLDQEFCCFVKRNRTLLDEISIKLIEKMQEEVDCITLSDYLAFTYDNKKGGWKALHYLMDKGLTNSLYEGFSFYTKYECFYDCVNFPSISSVCQYIHNAGGKAILAHPGESIKETDMVAFEDEVLRFTDLGLDGIECYYPTHSDETTNTCIQICKNKNLLITAGSDCHGEFGKTEIGENAIPIKMLNLGDMIKL